MKNSKKKIFLMLILFLGFINIANSVRAEDTEFIITKETDSVIEGVIKSTIEEEHLYAENSSVTTINSVNSNTLFYEQLTNSLSRKVYNSLKKDTTGIGLTQININEVYSVDATKFKNDDTFRQTIIESQIKGYIYDAIIAFSNDNPKIYWYYGAGSDIEYSLNKEKNQITYTSIKIESHFEEKNNYLQFNQKLKEVTNSINGTSTYEIAKKCHDYICDTVTYEYSENSLIDQTAYDALINQKGVCAAQARLFQLLCAEKGVHCTIINGIGKDISAGSGAHAWNYVYHPEEKKWYAVDVTWDNHKKNGDPTTYNYFLVGSNTVIKYSNGTCLFSEDHIPGGKNNRMQTFIPVFPELSENAYEKFSGKIKKSTISKTNQPVTVTATFNRELQEIPSGWTLSEDRKKMTKIFEDNISEQNTVTNVRGERLKASINISNIDKTAPIANVSYSNTNKTNQNIVVKISGNEELQSIKGWIISSDKKELAKTYNENKEEDVEILDIAGNKKIIHINVNNIDKLKPMLSISYNLNEVANGRVLVTITGNEELQKLEGWGISDNNLVLSKVYSENTSEQVIIRDLAGNESKKRITISDIGKSGVSYIRQYNINDKNIGITEVNIISDKQLKPKEGWTLSENQTIMSKIFTEDITEKVKIEDIDENEIELLINIDNYTENLITEVVYSNTQITNEDIRVTIISNKQLQEIDGWEISEDKKSLTKVYTDNIVESVTVIDLNNNLKEETIEIKNIDKVELELNVQYNDINENGEVRVLITSNKELEPKENWILSQDKKTLTRSYNSSIEEDILVQDLSGHQKIVTINVTEEQLKPKEIANRQSGLKSGNIVGENIEINNSIDEYNQAEKAKDSATEGDKQNKSKIILPNTGNYSIYKYLIIVLISIGFVSYIRYRRYKGIGK